MMHAIDSAVRFGRVDTAPAVSHSCLSEALTLQRGNCLRVGIGLALCGTRKMRRTPLCATAEQTALPRERGRPLRRRGAHKHLASHAGGPAQHHLGTTVGFFCSGQHPTSAEHSASLVAASPPLAPALSSVLFPLPSRLLSLSAFGRWLVARPSPGALRSALRPLPRS